MGFEQNKLAKKIFSLLDLTSLNETDNAESIAALCDKAEGPLGQVAAVCVYPRFVKQAAAILAGTSVKIATVANFPHGRDSLEEVSETIKVSLQCGAQEIDVVFPYADYLEGEKHRACDFIAVCKKICGKPILLKVILETGAIKDAALMAEISKNVILAGADFLKTSTGKISTGATLEAVTILLSSIKNSSSHSLDSVGLKVSGGVKTVDQALQYIQLAEKIMTPEWVIPQHFRLGASSLIDSLIISDNNI